jgi:lipoprotein LprG
MRPSRRPQPRVTALAVLLGVLLATLVACKGKGPDPAESLPAGDALLRDSAAAMREVKTVRFAIEADGTVSGLPLRRASGALTKEGSATGSAQVAQSGVNLELDFVVLGDSIYLKGLTGGWQKLPLALASSVYDPSAILDPERGIAKVLSTATEARTEAREKVGDTDAYRVAAKLDAPAVRTIVPGVGDEVTGQLWISADSKRLLRAKIMVPASGNDQGTTVTVTFSDFDAPVTVNAP